jgi:ATP-dependent Lon protease
VARKVARRIAAKEVEQERLEAGDISRVIGRPLVHPERAAPEDRVGIATGMYYTPVGGDIMFVEVSVMPGKGDLALTGQLGDVMKESARAALTYARSHAQALGIPDGALSDKDVHVHIPAGATPKEGPSAGVTMATALVSALSGVPVRHDIAMTGEITLSGRVLPIGGVKEKVLGATRAGITAVILPRENIADLEDLSTAERGVLTVHPVDSLSDVLAVALLRDGGGTPQPGGSSDAEQPELVAH